MSKGLISKKSTKKEPTKTMKEKKAAKRDKKNEKNNSGLLNKQYGVLNKQTQDLFLIATTFNGFLKITKQAVGGCFISRNLRVIPVKTGI